MNSVHGYLPSHRLTAASDLPEEAQQLPSRGEMGGTEPPTSVGPLVHVKTRKEGAAYS